MNLITIRYSTWSELEAVSYHGVEIREALNFFYEVYGSLVPGEEIVITISCDD